MNKFYLKLKNWLRKVVPPGGILWHIFVFPQRFKRHGFRIFRGILEARETKRMVEPLLTREFQKDHISIVIQSAGRKEYLEQTISAIQKYFNYDRTKTHWLIIDDYPASKETRDYIKSLNIFEKVIMNDRNRGIGYSINRIFAEIQSEFIFYCQEDFELLQPILVSDMLQILKNNPNLRQLMLSPEWKTLEGLRSTSKGYSEYTKMFGFTPYFASMEFFRKNLPFPFYFTNVEFSFKVARQGWTMSGVADNIERRPDVRHLGEKRTIPVVK